MKNYKQLDDKWIIMYQDDASRFIVGYGITSNPTSDFAIKVLEEAIKKYGKPASILTDRGTQFYANESEYREKGYETTSENCVRMV